MAALTLGTLAAAAAVGAAGGSVLAKRKKAARTPIEPPSGPRDGTPSIPLGSAIGGTVTPPSKPADGTPSIPVEESIRQAAGRRKAKLGRSGTLLTGPSGLTDQKPVRRSTLMGL